MEVVAENPKKVRKATYWGRLNQYLDEYKNILVIGVDFVGSQQMQETRIMLRGKGKILMGKNTIIRKVFRERMEKEPALEQLLPAVYGNIGFVFTNSDLAAIRKMVMEKKVPAAAKAGVLAPIDVSIPAGPTGLDPGQTSFFQALNIGTKIVKGTIEMTQSTKICTKGERVSTSAVALLNKLAIKPFEFGITTSYVMEAGSVYTVDVLDMSPADLSMKFLSGCNVFAALCFGMGVVTQATLPHSFGRIFKTVVAVALAADYMFDEMKVVKEMLDNPDAFKSAAAPTAGAGAAAKAPVAKAPEPEPEEEEAAPAPMFGSTGGDY